VVFKTLPNTLRSWSDFALAMAARALDMLDLTGVEGVRITSLFSHRTPRCPDELAFFAKSFAFEA
jgi:hypothetical protein